MNHLLVLLACLCTAYSHAVVPVVVPAVPAVHTPLAYGYGAGLFGHGYAPAGLWTKPLVHHLLKRSPHIPLEHHALPVTVVQPAAPVAFSHQSRVDLRATHALAPVLLPAVKPLAVPLPVPVIAKPLYYAAHGVFQPYSHLPHY